MHRFTGLGDGWLALPHLPNFVGDSANTSMTFNMSDMEVLPGDVIYLLRCLGKIIFPAL